MKTKSVWIAVLVLLMTAGWLMAQTATTGQIIGVVKDPTGAVLPGAKVTATSPTGEARTLTSDGEGYFRFTLLSPGLYKVTVEAPGFRPFTLDDINVKVTQTSEVGAGLVMAAASEAVSVTAEQPLVETTTASTGRVIDEGQVRQLPLPTRNFQQILTLSPGTVASLANNTELGRGDANIAVNGQRSTSNNVMVDGTMVNSPGTNSTPNISVPSPDAIQEFIVQTSMYDASQGRNTGGNIAVVTRSGNNAFHGSAFEFLRNEKLNANDFFLNHAGRPRPILKRNQFGGTFGGPIIKDKTFFFVSYQGTRERNGASLTNSLMSPNIPAGLTNDRSSAALNALGTSFGVAAINPIARSLLQATLPDGTYAIPSSAATAGTAATLPVVTPLSGISRFTEDQFNVNIDQQISSNNRLSGKFFFSNAPQFQSNFTFVGTNPYQVPGYGGNIEFLNRVFSLADQHIITPNLINEARFGYSRINGPSSPQEPFTNAQFGINNPLASQFPGMANIQVLGLFSIGPTALADQRSVTNTFTWSDMLSYNHGRHSLKFGGEVDHYRVDFRFNFFSRGQINFNSFQDFLNGKIAFGLLGNGVPDRGMRVTDMAWFIQDDYRVTDYLTLNLGIRLGRNGGINEIRGRLSNFDPAQYAALGKSCSVVAPCVYPGNGFQLLSPTQPLNPPDGWTAPRVGFSWKPLPDRNNLVVRGGFGVYFDRFSTRIANLQIFNYPYDIVGLNVLGTFANPFPNLAGLSFPLNTQIPSPVNLLPAIPPLLPLRTPLPISGMYADPDLRTPYVYQYNLGVQWEPLRNWLMELGYVGSKGTKLIDVYNYNQGTSVATAPYGVVNFSNNKALNGFEKAETHGISHYDSLQASLTKRLSMGLQFLASYTWSKSLDDGSGTPTNELAAMPGDQQNLSSQYGLSDFDRRHRFVFSGLYELPKFYDGSSGAVSRLANGWQVGGIATIQTGIPFSVLCTSGSALYNRADLSGAAGFNVGGSVKSKLNDYFSTAAFNSTCANAAPFGTSRRNILRGPSQRNVDLSIVKFIPLTEATKLEFRSEFFNAFNWANFANPNNNVMVPGTNGKITAASAGPRTIQFAMKFSF